MAGPKTDFDAPLSRYATRKRELEASMLEYSHRMRDINATRGGLYRYEGRSQQHYDVSPSHGTPTPRSHVHAFETVTPRNPAMAGGDRDHHSPGSRYTRHRRPLSFDEKELQLNKAAIAQRPRRDTKSERPPISIPTAGLPPLADGDARTSHEVSPHAKRFRVSLVQASDLYDLVDLSLKDKGSRDNTAKLANAEDGVRLMEEMEWAIRRKNQEHLLKSNKSGHGGDKQPKTISVMDNSDLLISKSIKNDATSKRDKPRQDRFKHDDVYLLDKHPEAEEKTSSAHGKTSSSSSPPDSRIPMDIFLEQAVSKHKKNNIMQLKVRPKRAKRMQLHKPELLAIPEDGGTFIRPSNSNTEQMRHEMLTSVVPLPSSTSLTAIKELAPLNKNRETLYEQNPNMVTSHNKRSSQRSHGLSDEAGKRSPRKLKGIRDRETRSSDSVDIDDLLLTSIYPPLPWDFDNGRDVRLRQVTVDKPNHKERAQRKMKRLIFLRDSPEHNYKREI